MTGIASPEDGIGRVIIAGAAMAIRISNCGKATALARHPRKRRRDGIFPVIASVREAISGRLGQSRRDCFVAALLAMTAPPASQPKHQAEVLHRGARGA